MRRVLSALVVLGLGSTPRAEGKDPSQSDLPLQAKLGAKARTYQLTGGKDWKAQIEEASKKGDRLPAPPAVDLVLEITNRTDKDVQFWVSGDPVELTLQLKGAGAKSVKAQGAVTLEFRAPKAMTLAAGKTYAIPINALKYGFRGAAAHAYWTEPGEYTLAAGLKTAVKPVPKGVTPDEEGFGRVTLTSEPVKIKVEESKGPGPAERGASAP